MREKKILEKQGRPLSVEKQKKTKSRKEANNSAMYCMCAIRFHNKMNLIETQMQNEPSTQQRPQNIRNAIYGTVCVYFFVHVSMRVNFVLLLSFVFLVLFLL